MSGQSALKVLEVSNFMPPHLGGIEVMIQTLCGGLRARGHEVHWIASAAPSPEERSTEVTRLRAWNVLEDRFSIPMPIWTPGGYRALLRRVRWADVVHVHDCLYLSSSAAVIAARAVSKKVLMTQHVGYVPYGPLLDRVQGTAYRTLGKALLSAVDRVTSYSPHVVEYFRSIGVTRDFALIPLGFPARFAPPTSQMRAVFRERWNLPAQGPVVIFAGRLVAKKGVAIVRGVHESMAREGVTLLVAGDGPLADQLVSLPRVVHVPRVEPARMHELYGASDALILPSRGEGLPLTLQEGLLTGIPSVVSNDPSFTSNLQGVPGVRMEADAAGVERALREVLRVHPPAAEISAWARARWGIERFLDDYEGLLRTLAPR